MERKIGEIFTYNGKIYQVVKSDICANCAFRENDCSIIRSRIGLCVSSIRFDKTNVVFKEIKMEIKNNQLTIDIPEGLEIRLWMRMDVQVSFPEQFHIVHHRKGLCVRH